MLAPVRTNPRCAGARDACEDQSKLEESESAKYTNYGQKVNCSVTINVGQTNRRIVC